MTPEQFVAKWRDASLNERAAAQSHFNDLCHLLDVPTPIEADPTGRSYRFEKPVRKNKGTKGFVDVWKRECFGWEYKGPRKNLVEAYAQLKQYTDDLANPPLLIVSDMYEIRIHTNFTNRIVQQKVIKLPDLISHEVRQHLRWCFTSPERLEPTATRESVTAEAAARFGKIGAALRQRYPQQDRRVAHFLTKLVFCLFVEDIELLPDRIFAGILDEAIKRPDDFVGMFSELFRAMANPNSRFGKTAIPWFNGGLFDDEDVLPLGSGAMMDLQSAARLDWSAIEPSIFGILFESSLDEKKREQMASLFDTLPLFDLQPRRQEQKRLPFERSSDKGVGIHYTDAATIMKIIDPVILRPLRDEWKEIQGKVIDLFKRRNKARADSQRTYLTNEADALYNAFRAKLSKFRVLDPACGSGNFLALALWHLKDFDLAVMKDAVAIGLPVDKARIGPEAVLGIEINPYAAELARLTVWITEMQWQLHNNFELKQRNPILGRLDGIVRGDALVGRDGSEAEWPSADVVVGNPPFLGSKRLRSALKDSYVESLFSLFSGRVPAEADLVTYWFRKASDYIGDGKLGAAGLVATNSIRGGASRRVLDEIVSSKTVFDAWDDEPWVIDGAAVRVSLICFGKSDTDNRPAKLNGQPVKIINADLTSSLNLTTASRLQENIGITFMGDTKGGAFEVSGSMARQWLAGPKNPNHRSNSEVLRPWINGMDITQRTSDKWIIDFGWEMNERQSAVFEAPFAYCANFVRPERIENRREAYAAYWWRHAEPRPGMRRALRSLARFIVTPRVSKHRIFVWMPVEVLADSATIAIARDDDMTFGILHSRFHAAWALRLGTSLEDRPRYTPSTTFETFPFPEGMTPNDLGARLSVNDPRGLAIGIAAKRLDELRQGWLNPSDLVCVVPEVVSGFPDRILPISPAAENALKKRTLTNLYNDPPIWLVNAHRDLDAAVAAAYGWSADISEGDALAALLDLNIDRAAQQGRATKTTRGPKKMPTPEQLRREPPLPPMSIGGGKNAKRRPRVNASSAPNLRKGSKAS